MSTTSTETTSSFADFLELDGPPTATPRAIAAPYVAARSSGAVADAIDPDRVRPTFVVVPAPAPAVEVVGVTVRADAAAAVARDEATAARAGVELPRTWFAAGTVMSADGEAKARSLRSSWEKLPYASEGLDGLIATVRAEERRDERDVATAGMRIDTAGRLDIGRAGVDPLHLTENAYRQIVERGSKTPRAAKWNVNAWIGGSSGETFVRTRNAHGAAGREAFAALSPRYTPMDIDVVAGLLLQHLPGGSRGRMRYDGGAAVMDASISQPFDAAGEVGVGRVHVAGVRVTTADDGTGALRVSLYVERIVCINCTILAGGKTVARRHVGDRNAIYDAIGEAIGTSSQALRVFQADWAEANERRMHALYDGTTESARRVFEQLVRGGHVAINGLANSTLIDNLVSAWELEPGSTEAAINRAVTRAAHSGTWGTSWVTEELEAQAGVLLNRHLPETFAAR